MQAELADAKAKSADKAAGRGRALPTIRTQLMMLILAAIVPSLIGFTVLIAYSYQSARVQIEQDTLQTARALSATVDRDLSIAENVAIALRGSRALETNDLAGFHERARGLLRDEFPGSGFVLSDETGQQLVNTFRPFGDPLPRHGDSAQLRKVFETGKPVISDLFTSPISQRPIVGIDVPVWRSGGVVYDLSVLFLPERLGKILTEQRLMPDRIAAIYDSKGIIVARTRLADRFVGRTGSPKVVERVREFLEGSVEADTLEGTHTISVFHRSSTTGWTVAIGIPKSIVLGELLNSLSLITFMAIGLFCIGLSAAWILGGRIGRSVRGLIAPARTLGTGMPMRAPLVSFAEAMEVADALKAVEGELDRYRLEAARQREKLERANAEAVQANLAKSKFLAAASHDLRQPVQALLLLLAGIERQVSDRPRVGKTVDLMRDAVNGLNGLLTGVLDISRLDAGAVTPALESVDLGALVARLGLEYAHLAEEKGLKLHVQARPLRARTDPQLLERVLRNLIENALRYTKKGGILLGFRLRGGHVRIDVIDTGIGIPDDKQQEIFEEFYQVHNVGRDAGEGLGLGLAIVARISGLLGAELRVASELGHGTRFSLLLPLDMTIPAAATPEPLFDNPGGCFLVIEDNASIRHGFETMLREWGYETLSAASGEEALERASSESWRFDAILADHRLGSGLTGVATAKEMEQSAGRPIPTIIITGDTAPERITEINASGYVVLHKPVTPEDLRRALAFLLTA